MKGHDLDGVSLVFGAVFFLIGAVFLVGGSAVPGSKLDAYWPVPVTALGLIIVAVAVRSVAGGNDHPTREG